MDQSRQAWQFVVLAALGCAAVLMLLAHGEGTAAAVLPTLLMGGSVLVGLATVKTIRPLVTRQDDRTVMIGRRPRSAPLEREKTLVLRAIKELEFDHAMGKIASHDFRDMEGRLRARALRLMQQLDAGGGYRKRIEQDLLKRLGEVRCKDSSSPS